MFKTIKCSFETNPKIQGSKGNLPHTIQENSGYDCRMQQTKVQPNRDVNVTPLEPLFAIEGGVCDRFCQSLRCINAHHS